jgi:endonuclease/exonuclease/phosphatase family metal-dependent hydrolase
MQLDYWFSDASGGAQPVSIDVPGNTGSLSDHRPVRVTFRLH